MPQQMELCKFRHLTVTPKVRLKDKVDPTQHKKKKASLMGDHKHRRFKVKTKPHVLAA